MCLKLSFIPIYFISAYPVLKGETQLLNILASHWERILCGDFKKQLWLSSVNLDIERFAGHEPSPAHSGMAMGHICMGFLPQVPRKPLRCHLFVELSFVCCLKYHKMLKLKNHQSYPPECRDENTQTQARTCLTKFHTYL